MVTYYIFKDMLEDCYIYVGKYINETYDSNAETSIYQNLFTGWWFCTNYINSEDIYETVCRIYLNNKMTIQDDKRQKNKF